MVGDGAGSVCVAGGGPAGMVLGLLLARAGVRVTVLESHDDFLRDFRGDTIHPTTLDLLRDLGLGERLEAVPHTSVETFDAVVNGARLTVADFRGVGRAGELWLMPQWDLLDLLADAGRAYPSFSLRLGTSAVGLLRDGPRVTGVVADGPAGREELRADLVVAADGRRSRLRDAAGRHLRTTGVAIDVLWFRVERPAVQPPDTIAYVGRDVVITIPRAGYHQTALLIPKGSYAAVRAEGIGRLQERVVATAPFLRPTIGGVSSWDDVSLLDVQIAHADRWWEDGFVMIGDAAHPMSPAFGVGISYAVQDAVALARAVVRAGGPAHVDAAVLRGVQRRRALPARAMQQLQRVVHSTVGRRSVRRALPPAALVRVAAALPSRLARPLLGRLVGAGLRPERLDF